MSTVALTYLIAGGLLFIAFLAVFFSSRKALDEKAHQHFIVAAGIDLEGEVTAKLERSHQYFNLEKLFKRAGVSPKRKHHLMILMFTLMSMAVVIKQFGIGYGILLPLLIFAISYLWLWNRANNRVNAILVQLPLFLDLVLRALGTGRSMESALQLATMETPEPLKNIFERVLRANQLGHDLGSAIQQMAELYRVQELYLIALAIRVNRNYGTSVRDLLKSVVKMIHDREAARRELRTMTGETRVTAWVLGLLPVMIAAYIVMMNPGYMMTMWEDDSGQMILLAALGFQMFGGFVLWRMIKSI